MRWGERSTIVQMDMIPALVAWIQRSEEPPTPALPC